MILISALLGALSGYIGASTSSLLPRMPAGSVIVVVSGLLFVISFLFAPNRGLLASSYRLLRLRFKIAKEHLLRGIYESIEKSGSPAPFFSAHDIQRTSQMAFPWLVCFLFLLQLQNLLFKQGSNYKLSEPGLDEAKRLTRNHRLWEEYLLSQTGIDANHVDFSADRVEHFLSAEIIHALEARLALKKDIKSKHPL